MKVRGDWIRDSDAQAVCAVLTSAGHRALFVGGAVRNDLLGEPVLEIDLATDAPPEKVLAAATAAGLKAVPTGIDHGTVTVVSGGKGFEVTTFRRDVETDGRRAKVSFSDDLLEDARRRDFTINALYAEPDGVILDPIGGLKDIRSRRIRFIGDADARIREDYLRILRFFRFFAHYGDPSRGFDPEAVDAISRLRNGVTGLSRERVTAELLKLLTARDPVVAAKGMAETGVLPLVLPGADIDLLERLVTTEREAGLCPDPIRRLAALGGDTSRLRLSRAQRRALDTLTASPEDVGPMELGYRLGEEAAQDVLVLRAARQGMAIDPAALADARSGARQTFPVRARDLPPGLKGPEVGERLRNLEQAWVASGFTLSKEELLN